MSIGECDCMTAEFCERGTRMRGDIVRDIERVQPVYADQKHMLDLTLSKLVISKNGRGLKGAEQCKTQRKSSQSKFQICSPLWVQPSWMVPTRRPTLEAPCYGGKNGRFASDE